MIISLDSQTRLKSTPQCWQIETEQVVNGKPVWKAIGYYSAPSTALLAAANRKIRTSTAEGFLEAVSACEKVAEEMGKHLELLK